MTDLNPKSEALNLKQSLNPNDINSKRLGSFGARILKMFRISVLGFRVYRLKGGYRAS